MLQQNLSVIVKLHHWTFQEIHKNNNNKTKVDKYYIITDKATGNMSCVPHPPFSRKLLCRKLMFYLGLFQNLSERKRTRDLISISRGSVSPWQILRMSQQRVNESTEGE